MGLNEIYIFIQGNNLMMTILPTMPQAFSVLSLEETQSEVRPLNHMSLESTSLNASLEPKHNEGSKNFKVNYYSHR